MNNIERARSIQRTLGTYKAARFLAKRGWSVEAALHILTEWKGVPRGTKRQARGGN